MLNIILLEKDGNCVGRVALMTFSALFLIEFYCQCIDVVLYGHLQMSFFLTVIFGSKETMVVIEVQL